VTSRAFREAYAAHRAAEGRGRDGLAGLHALPYLRHGPLARQWSVRARTFDRFMRWLPPARQRVLDLGAGNGWLCYRLAQRGHDTTAVDIRTDTVDGLGAASGYAPVLPRMFGRAAAAFDTLPFRAAQFDVAVFNAALHYAADLGRTFTEARRVVRSGGAIVILDSPCYEHARDGTAMVAEKRATGAQQFGSRAAELLRPSFIEYLTPARLAEAGAPLGLSWTHHRVRYPWWYAVRPWIARWRGRRTPSRFDLWTAVTP